MAQFISEDGKIIHDSTRARTLEKDGVVYKRVPKPKYKSRAARCNEVIIEIGAIGGNIEALLSEMKDLSVTDDIDKIIDISSSIVELSNSIDCSELESLRDEIEQWKSGMEGTGLENSDKYQVLSECYDYLDEAINGLEYVERLDAIEVAQSLEETEEFISNFTSSAEEIVSQIQEAIGALESCEFPGMYS